MAGQRQPIALVQAKGKKHLTKAEIAEREQTEVKAPSDRVTPPSYLTATQKKAFRKTVKELGDRPDFKLGVEALARLVIAQEKYREVTETIAKQPLMVTVAYDTGKKDAEGYPIMTEHEVVNSQVERLAIIQDRYFKQCRQGAADFD
ncbi:MAG: phage terminase small subunit P27 family [Clostridium sp.]